MMTNETATHNPWLAERVRDVHASIEELRREVAPLAYLQRGWRPPEGGWSIAQVLEHLIITDQSYIDTLAPLLARPPQQPACQTWKPTLIGSLLVRSQLPDSRRKWRAPARWRPGPEPRAHPLEEYIQTRQRLLELLRQADGHDLRTKLSSPAARLVRLNLGDVFMTLVVHTQRHLQQIARIKAHAEFPRSG